MKAKAEKVTIPYGYCHCGCGQKTNIRLSKFDSHIKGEPLKYLQYHSIRRGSVHSRWNGGRMIHSRGYIKIFKPEHNRADVQGYVFEHILICEKALGKSLPDSSEPHHVNGIKSDNRNCNLVLCQDRSYHVLLEQRTRALKACGHTSWRKCPYCKTWDNPENMYHHPNGTYRHRSCVNKYTKERSNHETSYDAYKRIGHIYGLADRLQKTNLIFWRYDCLSFRDEMGRYHNSGFF